MDIYKASLEGLKGLWMFQELPPEKKHRKALNIRAVHCFKCSIRLPGTPLPKAPPPETALKSRKSPEVRTSSCSGGLLGLAGLLPAKEFLICLKGASSVPGMQVKEGNHHQPINT